MRTRMLPISSVRHSAAPVSPAWAVSGTFAQSVIQKATSSMRIRRSLPSIGPVVAWGGSASPAQHPRLDRIDEVAAFLARPRVFLLQPVIPFRLAVGIVDEEEGRRVTQPALLQRDDVAVLVEELAHEER